MMTGPDDQQAPLREPTGWWQRARWRPREDAFIGLTEIRFAIIVACSIAGGVIATCSWDRYQVQSWKHDVAPTLAAVIATVETEIEALPGCVEIDGRVTCDSLDSLDSETLWRLRAEAISRLDPQVSEALNAIYHHSRDEVGIIIRTEIELDLWNILESDLRQDLSAAVADRDDAAFDAALDRLKGHLSRLSLNARESGLGVPEIAWPPLPSMWVEE